MSHTFFSLPLLHRPIVPFFFRCAKPRPTRILWRFFCGKKEKKRTLLLFFSRRLSCSHHRIFGVFRCLARVAFGRMSDLYVRALSLFFLLQQHETAFRQKAGFELHETAEKIFMLPHRARRVFASCRRREKKYNGRCDRGEKKEQYTERSVIESASTRDPLARGREPTAEVGTTTA